MVFLIFLVLLLGDYLMFGWILPPMVSSSNQIIFILGFIWTILTVLANPVIIYLLFTRKE